MFEFLRDRRQAAVGGAEKKRHADGTLLRDSIEACTEGVW